uniref:Protein kinase domain-containing protein n=1 Tax=Xiphophorus maculatus TaxID=8083 RepID=M3ZFD3_XIPMA
MRVVTLQQVGNGDEHTGNDDRDHQGEEGNAGQHRQQKLKSFEMCNVPSKKTNPTTDITIVMRANRRKTPTGRAAMALNSSRARAKKGRLRRYCPTFVLITCAICRRGNNTPGSSNLPNRENTMDDRGISVKLNLKLEKYVVLQGKLSVYHTEGFLGEGSYGTVVKCTKLDNEELVAVKVLRKDCFKEGKKEAKILRKILQLDPEKNNLLKFIESFKYKGYLCLAFEILDVSVFDFIKSRGFVPLSLSEIRVIAQQLLVALNALKSAGLVHADIKPDNIMFVNHRSQPLKVKLIDFGLAVKVSKLWFVGTVQAIGYRAPEVILGLKMDESVDMWSLGCSLAYMYLGYNLYPTHCVYEVIRAIFRLNTPAEYTNATGYGTQFKSGIYNRLHSLDDLLKTRPRPMNPMEREDSLGFISLLKQMLLVDPEVRITPGDALSHPLNVCWYIPLRSE